jgi:hypothetical protein
MLGFNVWHNQEMGVDTSANICRKVVKVGPDTSPEIFIGDCWPSAEAETHGSYRDIWVSTDGNGSHSTEFRATNPAESSKYIKIIRGRFGYKSSISCTKFHS